MKDRVPTNEQLSRRTFLKSSIAASSVVAASANSTAGKATSSNFENLPDSLFSNPHSKKVLRSLFKNASWESTITLFLPGGFSHLDAWCNRPQLAISNGQTFQRNGKTFEALAPIAGYAGSPFSDLLPNLSSQSRKMALIHGVSTTSTHHGDAAKDWSAITDLHSHSLGTSPNSSIQSLLQSRDWFGKSNPSTAHVAVQIEKGVQALGAGVKHQTIRIVGPGLDGWDAHRDIAKSYREGLESIDRPIAGLLEFLSASGHLQNTLVMCVSEFGRSPFQENESGAGRGHQNEAFSIWMAGAGIEGNQSVGEVDSIGLPIQAKQIPAADISKLVASASVSRI